MKKNISKYLNSFLVPIGLMMLFFSCEESTNLIYYDKNAPAPMLIDKSTISVENEAGKSILKYSVPEDENLLYVKAVYESAPGVVRQTQSSRFIDTLSIEGFAAAGNYTVKLYSVGKNEKESEAVEITVSPLTPPLVDAFPSLHMISVFGGVEGSFSNSHKTPLKAVLMADTANTGELIFLKSFSSNSDKAVFSLRGLEAKPTKYYVYLTDRWGNRTETKEYELTPMFEERLDKTIWKEHKLPSDFQNIHENNNPLYQFSGLFSDYIVPWGVFGGNFIPQILPLPSYFTIDLGITVKISRIVLVPWWAWTFSNSPRLFEVYGSASPNPGDDLNGDEWQLLGQFRSYKPSGEDPYTITDEDIDFAWPDGENYDVLPSELQPDPYFPIRIIRFKIIQVWDSDDVYGIDELILWGEVVK